MIKITPPLSDMNALQQKNIVIRRNKRSKRMKLLVYGNGKVMVTAPKRISLKDIWIFVTNHEDWISKTIEKEKNRFVEAPSFYSCRARSLKKIKMAVNDYIFKNNLVINGVKVKQMRTQWGSCSSKGILCFNYKLAYLPEHLMNYVIVHELAHLKHMNHSKSFWVEVKRMMPEYLKYKNELGRYSCA